MYCKKCGAKNKDDARFCAKCGCDMTQKIIVQDHKKQKKTEKKPKPVEKKPKPAKKSTSNPILRNVIFVVICVAVGIGAAFIYQQQKKEKQNSTTVKNNIIKSTESATEDSTIQTTKTEEGFDPNQYNTQTQTLPYTDNTSMNLSACTKTNNYEKATSKDGAFSFIYPKTIFNDSSADDENDEYTLEYRDIKDNELKIGLKVSVEEAEYSGDPVKSVKSKYLDRKDSISTLGYDYPKCGKDPKIHDGKASMIIMGYKDDEKKEAQYSLFTSDGEDTYIMEIEFEDSDYKDSYKEINYIIDCMYRGCSFTNSSYKVRTYQQFKNDEMGEKK